MQGKTLPFWIAQRAGFQELRFLYAIDVFAWSTKITRCTWEPAIVRPTRQLSQPKGCAGNDEPQRLHHMLCALPFNTSGQHHDGTGRLSVYGEPFADENFILRHVGPGILTCCNSGPDTNTSTFMVTTVEVKIKASLVLLVCGVLNTVTWL